MTDKLISDLSAIGAAIADNTAFEAQRNGQTTTEQALGSDLKTYVKSWIVKGDVGLGNVDNTSDATKNAASATLTNKTLTSPVINSPTGIVKGDVGLGNINNRVGFTSGNWYMPDGQVVGSGANSQNLIRFVPFYVRKSVTITDMGANVSTLSAGQNIQFAIYASSVSTNKPTGAALGTTPDVSVAATGRVSGTFSSPVALTPGLYYAAVNMSDATAQINFLATPNANAFPSDVGDSTLTNLWNISNSFASGYSLSRTYASGWFDVSASSFTTATGFAFAFKVS